MKSFFTMLLVCIILINPVIYCQSSPIDKVQFLKDETPLNATLETYWSKVIKQKNKVGKIFSARFICKLPEGTSINEQVGLEVRGHFRRDYCYLPPLKLIFDKNTSPVMYPLKSIKLVSACSLNGNSDQNLLKEFLIYKIYNLITDKSFRVRLLNLNYKDSSEKKSGFTEHAFLIEDVKEMSKRNNCKEWTKQKLHSESTDRSQMTVVAVFQYMIGNTDWAVPVYHNIKLIQSKEDSNSKPFSVPYDFDYSGLVNADYAIPDPMLHIDNVQQRLYRGFSRTMEELNEVLEVLKQQKEKIYAVINNFDLLNPRNKKNMISYLEDFYDLIKNPKGVKSIFIDNARTE